MCAGDPRLLGDCILAVMSRDRLNREIGDAGEVLAVVATDGVLPVEYLTGRNDLVPGVVEGGDDRVEIVRAFCGGMRLEDRLARGLSEFQISDRQRAAILLQGGWATEGQHSYEADAAPRRAPRLKSVRFGTR